MHSWWAGLSLTVQMCDLDPPEICWIDATRWSHEPFLKAAAIIISAHLLQSDQSQSRVNTGEAAPGLPESASKRYRAPRCWEMHILARADCNWIAFVTCCIAVCWVYYCFICSDNAAYFVSVNLTHGGLTKSRDVPRAYIGAPHCLQFTGPKFVWCIGFCVTNHLDDRHLCNAKVRFGLGLRLVWLLFVLRLLQ